MGKITVENWMQDIKNSIINDVKDVAEKYHAKIQQPTHGGFFSIPRQVFCYIDYLGKVAYGSDSVKFNLVG